MVPGSQFAASSSTRVVSLVHLGVGAAHRAGQRLRPAHVLDDQVIGDERPLLAVERDQRLAVARAPHPEQSALDPVQVEGVHRLTELEHHVVGDVDHVADAPHAAALQTTPEPRRRRADAHALEHPGREPRTPHRVGDLDADRVRGRRARLHRHPELSLQRHPQHRRRLARDAQVAERVAPVGGDVHLEHRVLEAQRLRQRRPGDQVPVAGSAARSHRRRDPAPSPSRASRGSPRRGGWRAGWSCPPGSEVPTVASGTRSPTWKFFAPQTICSGRRRPRPG